jgi:hypothetical protein
MTVILIAMGVLAIAGTVQAVRLARTRGDWRPILVIAGSVVLILALWRLGALRSGGY